MLSRLVGFVLLVHRLGDLASAVYMVNADWEDKEWITQTQHVVFPKNNPKVKLSGTLTFISLLVNHWGDFPTIPVFRHNRKSN